MRAAVAMAVVLLAPAALADLGERCRAACLRHVREPREQARACGGCVLDPEAGGWLQRVARVPADLLQDPDWEVRWAALRLASKDKGSAEGALAEWIVHAGEDDRVTACGTAVHVAGLQRATVEALLAGAPEAARACAGLAVRVKAALEPELYDTDAPARHQALAHLAAAFGLGTGRVMLDAVRTRPVRSDGLAAQLLVDAALAGGPPAGLALLRAAGPGDEAAMDRLLAVYSLTRDQHRPGLASGEKAARLQAVHALAPLAPLSQPELTAALADQAPSVRAAAAGALAAGEGRTLTEAAAARLEAASPPPVEERRRWLQVLADVGGRGCGELVLRVTRDAGQPEALRAAALQAVPLCAPARALDEAADAYARGGVELKAAAVSAAGALGREPRTAALVEEALHAPEPQVLMAAAEAAAGLHLRRLAPRVLALLETGAPEVRMAAARAAVLLEQAPATPRVGRCLRSDPSPAVRAVCADVLGGVGGGPVIGALLEASKNDPDAHVKFVARESLRRLGVATPPGR